MCETIRNYSNTTRTGNWGPLSMETCWLDVNMPFDPLFKRRDVLAWALWSWPTARCALVGMFWLFVASASAQSPRGDVRIHVVDATNTPVVAAEVTQQGERRHSVSTRTDSAGVAYIVGLNAGLWVLTVRRLGLKPVAGTIRLGMGHNAYTVRTEASALVLVGVRVVGDRTFSARLDDFERRRLAGTPSAVVTQEQIDRIGPIQISRMLRGLAGLRIGDSLGATVAISSRGAKASRPQNGSAPLILTQCVMRVSIDGIILPALSNIDHIVPTDVYGIEVYYGPARMPPELAGLRTDNWCGLIAIWTRDR